MNRAALFNRYPEWIIGQDGASRFITHCRYPRLIAKIHRQTDGERLALAADEVFERPAGPG
ncbi:hypothetical protein ACDU81_001746, partial [Neisseria gonorrhoeae]